MEHDTPNYSQQNIIIEYKIKKQRVTCQQRFKNPFEVLRISHYMKKISTIEAYPTKN